MRNTCKMHVKCIANRFFFLSLFLRASFQALWSVKREGSARSREVCSKNNLTNDSGYPWGNAEEDDDPRHLSDVMMDCDIYAC